jgi:hypothetical protein
MTLLDALFGRRCRLCTGRGVTLVGTVAPTQQGLFHTRDFSLQRCRRCDTVYLEPLPTAADLKALYEDATQFVNDPHYTDPEQVARILDFYTTSVRNLGLLREGAARILEIGAGLAWVSRACKAVDPAVTTVAQDVSAECAQLCGDWVDHYLVGPLGVAQRYGPFALVSLTHVIEHLVDPEAMLHAISAMLEPGGGIFVTAPYRPSGWRPRQGLAPWREYSYLHVPAHVTYFSRRWFELRAPRELRIEHWDASAENGQAFELVLRKAHR